MVTRMAHLDEQLVEQWLNKNKFFTIQGLKSGNDEIDFLAIRLLDDGGVEYKHVEVQVSFRPIGFVCGLPLATKEQVDVQAGVDAWIHKKFLSPRKVQLREMYAPRNAKWEFVLVHGEMKHSIESEIFQKSIIQLVPYKSVLSELSSEVAHVTSSPANGILEILRYVANRNGK